MSVATMEGKRRSELLKCLKACGDDAKCMMLCLEVGK